MSNFSVESKSQLVKLLAVENLTVEHQKIQTAKFDPKNRVLYLPIWQNMSGALYDLLGGHEVGHALYTPADGWHDAAQSRGKAYKSFLNVIEDARIEKKVKRRYPGLRKSFVDGYKNLIDRDFFGIKDEDINEMSFINRLNLFTKSGGTLGDNILDITFSAQEQTLVKKVEAVETWEDVLKVTEEVWKYSKDEQFEMAEEFFDSLDIDDYDYDGEDDSQGSQDGGDFEDEESEEGEDSKNESGSNSQNDEDNELDQDQENENPSNGKDSDESNEWYNIKRGDSVQLIKSLPDESIGLSVFSPPFAELYTYSSHVEDMGNSKDYNEFLTQFGFLIKELYRVLMQGRNVAVHCMDLPIQKGKEGFIGLRDFSGMILKAFEDAGFIYASRITIWKDPVVEMQRTKALGLLHKQVKKDSTMSRVGIPDYVMIFRKDGERSSPVTNTDLSVDLWQKYASPVWMDINYGNTLQGYRNGRDENDEKHICPLQLDTIERLIHLYSNKGDTIFTPFMGIGSEVFQAVKMERKGIGFELKESYYNLAKKNLATCIESKKQLTLL